MAQRAKNAASYWRAVVRKIASQPSIVGMAMHGQLSGESLKDFACIEQIQGEAKDKLRLLLQESLLQCECRGEPIVRNDITLDKARLPLLSIPLRLSAPAELNTAVCFVLRPLADQELLLPAERLQSLLLQAALYIPGSREHSQAPSPQTRTLELIGKSSAYRNTREFAYELVASLATRYGCSKVSLGLVEQAQVRVLAISGSDQFKASSPGVMDVQQAMAEAADSGQIVADQGLVVSKLARSMPIHKRLATTSRSAVISLPLKSGEDCVAVVTLQRDAHSPFTDADIEGLESLLAPFGPALALSRRGDRSFIEHFRQVARSGLGYLCSPRTKIGWAARIVALVGVLVFFLGWMPYRPTTSCNVMPANLNQSIAGFNMKLAESMVRSGDVVQAGQILARFDTRELELERERLAAKVNQAEVEVRKALNHGDAASAALAKTASKSLQCQLNSVESKIKDCTLVAPADGMVIDADLERRIGQVFTPGELILAFAPMDQWELQLQVPERLAQYIQKDQVGSFGPSATPGQTYAYRITSVAGTAEIVEGKNVIIARAAVEGTPINLRHGMTGVASTNTGWRPVCWVALHGVYETLCNLFWL